jgi:hypothetical protein
MSKNVRLIIFDPREVYEVIEGTASGIPFRFLAEDGRTFLLYPHICVDQVANGGESTCDSV